MSPNEIVIFTQRLLLRPLRASDAEAMFRYRSDPQVDKFQGLKPKTIDDINEFINVKICKIPDVPNTWYQLGIINKTADELIGDIGIHFIGGEDLHVEIGYTLSLEYQGKGYASEAVAGVIDYLFEVLKKHRITASVDPRNIRSIALLERIGMRKEAHFIKSIWFDDEWADDIIYAVLNEEWICKKDKK